MNNMYPMITPISDGQNWYTSTGIPQPQYDGFGNTNIYKVTSHDEAIMKSNMRPSDTVYFHQTKNEFYNVRVDINGNKSWQTFVYNMPNAAENAPVSRADFDALIARVTVLEGKNTSKTEGTDNAEPNG